VAGRIPGGRVIKVESFAKKRDAQRRKNEIEYEQDTGMFTDPERGEVPLEEFREYFIPAYKPDARATESLYRRHARLYILPKLGRRPLQSITAQDVRTLLADLRWSRRWAGHYRCRVPPS
jgi:hypothetical protein